MHPAAANLATFTPSPNCPYRSGGARLWSTAGVDYSAAVPDVVVRPLLFLDIDGVLISFGGSPPPAAPAHSAQPTDLEPGTNPLLARLNPQHGQRLLALPCDLVWTTSWDHEANQVVAPRIGLPELPTVDWTELPEDEPGDRVHWKTRDLVAWAVGRPFVWSMTRSLGPALLHRVTPAIGITAADFDAIGQWLARQQSTVTG